MHVVSTVHAFTSDSKAKHNTLSDWGRKHKAIAHGASKAIEGNTRMPYNRLAGYLEWAIKLVLCHIEQRLVVVGPCYIASCILQPKQSSNPSISGTAAELAANCASHTAWQEQRVHTKGLWEVPAHQ